jgi:hypothetical protein
MRIGRRSLCRQRFILLLHLNLPEGVTGVQARRKTLIELADEVRANAQATPLDLRGTRPSANDGRRAIAYTAMTGRGADEGIQPVRSSAPAVPIRAGIC